MMEKDSSWGLASLILGIVSFFMFIFFIIPIAGIVVGIIALKKHKTYPKLYSGEDMAAVGLILSGISLLFAILLIGIVVIFLPAIVPV